MPDPVSDSSQALDALAFSLQIALLSTLVASVVGIPLAWARAGGGRGRGRRKVPRRLWTVIEAAVLLALVLPPTVIGYLLLVLLGSNSAGGRWLWSTWGYSPLFRDESAVFAAAVVALPLIYLPARTAFGDIDPDLDDTARIFGVSGWRRFVSVSLPLARRGVLSGVVLGFARALGEFGATVMVLGLQPGKLTLPLVVWGHYETGELSRGVPAILLLTGAALTLIVCFEWLDEGKR